MPCAAGIPYNDVVSPPDDRKGVPSVPKLEIHLLGAPRVRAAGRAAPIPRRRALALAAYLAATRAPHTRDGLAAMFWPDAGRDDALAQLRNHLWVLRQAGLGPWLATEGETVELRQDENLWVDVREHQRLLKSAGLVAGRGSALSMRAEPMLSEAVVLYREHFLAGFSLAGSFAFEEWQLREEETLRVAQGGALDALIHLREERGDLEGALASARQRADLDPLDEQALRTLMSLFARLGRRGEALQLYERFKKLIARELEIAPCRETILLRNEILARGPEQAISAPAAVATRQLVLPEPPTPFVGREQELEEIARLLGEPDLRLLTLTGPGGCGKTRLALEAGHRLNELFPDGVIFVSLVSVEAGHLLLTALAEALALPLGTRDRGPARGGGASSGSCGELIDFLHEKRMLLILDNLEHIANDLGPLREILAGARRCVLLVTSRSRLRVAGERVLEVEGLPWPERKATLEAVSRCASVRLFLQAIRRARSSFTPSRADLSSAAEISRRLQGHPLGLELSATWAHSLSVAEIAHQLAESLDVEAAPRADVPPRHRSLRAVFEQSWDLLSSNEQATFRRLSSLPGSFDREAAQEIGQTTLATFTALIEQSFLRRTRDQRFEILETLRQFGRAKLAESAREQAAVRDRAARYYLDRIVSSRAALEGAGQKEALRGLARDRHNLRQAWLRAAERGWVAKMLPAVRPLFLFYDMSSRAVEGAATLESTLRHLANRVEPQGRRVTSQRRPGVAGRSPWRIRGAAARRLLVLTHVALAWFLRYENPARCRRLAREGRRELHTVGRPVERAFADVIAAILSPTSAHTQRELREGALQCERAGDLWCAGLAWEVLAYHLRGRDPEEALRAVHRSLALRRRSRDRWSIALGQYVLGILLEQRGLLRGARRRYEESMSLRRRLGVDPDGVLDCLAGISRVALHAGAMQDARRYSAEGLALAQRLGQRTKLGLAQTRLAQINLLTGSPAEAHALIESALVIAEDRQNAAWISHLHELSGIVALDTGDVEEARWCLARALEAEPPEVQERPSAATSDSWRQAWSTGWRDLLAGRLALEREDYAASRRALADALQDARACHHDPLVAQIVAVQTELRARGGEEPPSEH
jgi:predicted ATPase/DNA-binding SARP family transcriptional activator